MTSFDIVYGLNQVIQNDRNLKSMPDNLYYYFLYQWLLFAIALFRKKSFIDLDGRTEFQQETYNFVGDGIITVFNLSPSPPTGSLFYISVDGVEIPSTNYSFDSGTDNLTITPAVTGDIYVGTYVIGSFNEDLGVSETTILAQGMNIPFMGSQVFNTDNTEQIMYSMGVNFHSQGNHNKTNNTIKEDLSQRFSQIMIEYTYDEDPDDLKGLAGGQSG